MNIATIIVLLILAVVVIFSARSVIRQQKAGTCFGCSSCKKNCVHCSKDE